MIIRLTKWELNDQSAEATPDNGSTLTHEVVDVFLHSADLDVCEMQDNQT